MWSENNVHPLTHLQIDILYIPFAPNTSQGRHVTLHFLFRRELSRAHVADEAPDLEMNTTVVPVVGPLPTLDQPNTCFAFHRRIACLSWVDCQFRDCFLWKCWATGFLVYVVLLLIHANITIWLNIEPQEMIFRTEHGHFKKEILIPTVRKFFAQVKFSILASLRI